jgi:CYTH domain-containing protein
MTYLSGANSFPSILPRYNADMPTENERKYVLDPACEKLFADVKKVRIRQGYINGKMPRLRATQRSGGDAVVFGEYAYVFCYKQKVGNRLIEIETEIDRRDFDDLWTLTKRRLIKTRYILDHPDFNRWEVDFFKDNKGKTYFAMAEYEMPEGQSKPGSFPPIIWDHLLHLVPRKHNDLFSSSLLASPSYAKTLLKKLRS